MKHLNQSAPIRTGDGSEAFPFRSEDGTANIQTGLNSLSERGGRLELECGCYEIMEKIVLDTPSTCLSGGVWACNTDPNGVFESSFGTKIRMRGTDYPAFEIGRSCDPVSGSIIRDLGIQGDIRGMDTRGLVDFHMPEKAAGLCLSSVRTDQCAFTKIAFCGLANAVAATGDAEIDACIFEELNTDGCGNGLWFSPRASYYVRVRSCIFADNPYYGVYLGGADKHIHNLEILDCHFVRNGGAFVDGDGQLSAAVFFDRISNCAVTHCIFDAPGTFWYYHENAVQNSERQPVRRITPALRIVGDRNRIRDNTFLNSSGDSIWIRGDGNILIGNIADGDVYISGAGNTVSTLIFTKPDARLILEGDARDTTAIYGVEASRIVMR